MKVLTFTARIHIFTPTSSYLKLTTKLDAMNKENIIANSLRFQMKPLDIRREARNE